MDSNPLPLPLQTWALLVTLVQDGLDFGATANPAGDLWRALVVAVQTDKAIPETLKHLTAGLESAAVEATLNGMNLREHSALVFVMLYEFCQADNNHLEIASKNLALSRAWKAGKATAAKPHEEVALEDLLITARSLAQ
jgi:hypothetical protein